MVHQQLSRGNGDYLQRCIADAAVDTWGRFEQLWLLHCPARNLPLALDSRHSASTWNNERYSLVQFSEQKSSIWLQIPSLYCSILSDSLVIIWGYNLLLVRYPVPSREYRWRGQPSRQHCHVRSRRLIRLGYRHTTNRSRAVSDPHR